MAGVTLVPGCATIAEQNQVWYGSLPRFPPHSLNDPLMKVALYQGKYEKEDHGLLASVGVFEELPYQRIAKHLRVHDRDEVTVLYPGAGDHLSPLEMAIGLSRLRGHSLRTNFIYTEVQDEKPQEFAELVDLLNPFDIRITGRREVPQSKGKDVEFDLSVLQRDVRVIYRMNRSDVSQGDHSYFREEDCVNADVVLFHDSFVYKPEVPTALLYCLEKNRENPKPQVFIFEDIAHVTQGENSLDSYDVLPGKVFVEGGEYGCPAPYLGGAVVYFPDKEALKERLPQPDFKEQVKRLYDFAPRGLMGERIEL